ncbi:MAG: class I SAM-dependent methyltransferase [Elusimicrobiota bacterium]|nr:class I SAM-dependent methyltransferase [Elusimicrobiota bacterium]
MKEEPCPVCGGATAPAAGGLPECGACGLAFRAEKYFGAPAYEPGLEEDIYSRAQKDLFREALDFLDRALPAGRLLDIGCAGGELLKTAAARGWEAEGVELAPLLAAKALARGFKVHTRPVEEAGLAGGAYDAVTVLGVFSLMDNPPAATAELLRLLKPGGVIYIRDLNAAFHLPFYRLEKAGFFRPLGVSPSVIHNFNFRAGTLRVLLGRAGFRGIRIRNSRPTAGDPYRTGGALGGFFTGALKVLYYWLAQALWFFTLGRVYAGSALIVTARK